MTIRDDLATRIMKWADEDAAPSLRLPCCYAADLLRFMNFFECGPPMARRCESSRLVFFSWMRRSRFLEVGVDEDGVFHVEMFVVDDDFTTRRFEFASNKPSVELFDDLFEWLTSY